MEDVAAALEDLALEPKETWADKLPRLRASLKAIYEEELEAIDASRAKTATKWDRELALTAEHMRLKRLLGKLERRSRSSSS